MAYAAAVTYTCEVIDGRRVCIATVAETELAATSEYTLTPGSYFESGVWKLVRAKAILTGGSGATIAPIFGMATNPAAGTAAYVGTLGAAAASHDTTNSGAGWVANGSPLYVRTVPNAAADNAATSVYYFIEGWH